MRIDDYTYLHAVAETTDGRLYSAARFVKAAGGCSAPAGKDQALALERLGKMKLTLADRTTPGAPVAAKLLVSHPNYSGLQMDQLSRNYIPADFMQTLEVSYNGSSVFRLESDISISEDPGFNFSFRPADAAEPRCAHRRDPRQQSAPLHPELAGSRRPADVAATRVSLALQVCLGLGAAQLLDHRLELGRVAKQTDAASHPAPAWRLRAVSACS